MGSSVIGTDNQGRHALEKQLSAWWEGALGIPAIGIHDDLFQRGCDPERGGIVLGQIRRELQIDVPISDLFEARTISKLADLIEIRQASMDAFSIIAIRRAGRKQPLILVHGVGGNLLGFVSLVRLLEPDRPVFGVQAQALQSGRPVLIQLESMAAYYVRELRSVQPNGPYAFLGLSFGGLVAYEMAQQLVASGETVNLVGMLDTWQPEYMRHAKISVSLPKRVLHRLNMARLHTRKLSAPQTLRYALGRVKGRLLRLMYLRLRATAGVSLPESMRRVRDINLMAGARYVVRPYPGKVTLFRAFDLSEPKLPEDLGWRSYAAGGVDIVHLPGDHGQVLVEPNVSFLARHLTADLTDISNRPCTLEKTARTEFELLGDDGLDSPDASANPSRPADVALLTGKVVADHMTEVPASRLNMPVKLWPTNPHASMSKEYR